MTTPGSKRPILILGATSDIGRAIAHRFAAEGRPIQLAARRLEALEADSKDITLRYGVPVTMHWFDAVALDQAESFFDSLPEKPGIVVSVVGALPDQPKAETDSRLARETVEANFIGPTVALEVAARRLARLDEDGTAVVGVSSIAGDRGRAKNYWYGASKAAFTAALSGMRQKYAQDKLLIMTVKPGFVDTKMTEGMDLIGPLTAKPDDIARLVQKGIKHRRRVVYPFKWRVIMAVLRLIPERRFEKLKF